MKKQQFFCKERLQPFLTVIILIMALPLLAASFTDRGDGTVLDSASNLVWQKCSMGLTSPACTGTATSATWAAALTYCNTLTLSGRTWRLPNVNELSSLVDTTVTPAPAAINNTIFPGTLANFYWSSSTYVPVTANAWYVFFLDGSVGFSLKTVSSSVRCVSTGP
ncbi:MAG: DUF1566 domain-containing protein [Spirochaetia bacterium]|nr:DUF1566 domain-containing protein [Spirochaetia bacterium]